MPGRGDGAWPQVPAARQGSLDFDTGVGGGDANLYDERSSGGDLGVDAGAGPDPGVAGRGRTPPRESAPAQRSTAGANGRAGSGEKPGSREARFGRGQRVKHLEYGAGTVIASSVLGTEELVLVRFDTRPDKPKNLSLAIHRLEPA